MHISIKKVNIPVFKKGIITDFVSSLHVYVYCIYFCHQADLVLQKNKLIKTSFVLVTNSDPSSVV